MYFKLSLLFFLFLCFTPATHAQNSTTGIAHEEASFDEPSVPPQEPPLREITLEANVVQIILNDEHRNGVDWGAIVSDFHTAALHRQDNPLAPDKKYRLSFGTVSQDDYGVLLEALDTVGKMSQFQQPSFKVTIEAPASVTFEGQNMRLDASLVHLKPSQPLLRLEPRISVLTAESRGGRKTPVSLLLTTQTDMVVKDNATIVIGGFIKEEEITKTHKFPLLGDLPLVGLVFRSQGHLVRRTETVVFLTVRAKAVETSKEQSPKS